jgi:hypothetical protein
MSIWDFLQPGLGDRSDVQVDLDGEAVGHLSTFGEQGSHLDPHHQQHALTYQAPAGVFHHQTALGDPAGSAWTDGAGTVHHADILGHEIGRSWSDGSGQAHHQNAFGHEVATSQVDALGHVAVRLAAGQHAPDGAADPFTLLNALLNSR